MARRGHGEGSISRRKDGRWMAALTLENHKRRYFYGKTRKEVQDKLNAALHEQKQGTLITGSQQTLGAYLERWLEQVCKLTKRPNTHFQYSFMLHHHVIPALGHVKLQKLTPEMVQSFFSQKQRDGLKPATLVIIHAALSGALENALRWGLVVRNVAKLVTLPHVEKYKSQVLSLEQALKLLEVARGSRIETLLLVALTTGMRRGELLALRWEDVDFEKRVLQVQRTMNHLTGRGYVEGKPKSDAGIREIVLPEVAVVSLRKHRAKQEQARMEMGKKWSDRGIVFSNIYGAFLNPDAVLIELKKLLQDAQLPSIRFHDLRHTAATILRKEGIDLKAVQELLGHSSIATTADIYAHVLPEERREVAGKMDDVFGQL